MSLDDDAQRLVQYIESRTDFILCKVDPPYGHMGATIADTVLQANNRYSSVTPRVQRILTRWPNATSVTAVLEVLESVPTVSFLNWNGVDRAERFDSILCVLNKERVETETDLETWMMKDANLQKLRAIHGVGPKTVDYLKIMVGSQSIAIDRRLLTFLSGAGIACQSSDYDRAREILRRAAVLLSIPPADFDHSIWRYIGEGGAPSCA